MKNYVHINVITIFVMGISILLTACSDNSKLVQKAAENAPWFGVKIKDIPEKDLDELKLDHGVEIVRVYKNSPAEKAGLEVNDILLSFNSHPIEEIDDLIDRVNETKIDDMVKITYIRNGQEKETMATIAGKSKWIWKKSYSWFDGGGKHKNKWFNFESEHAWLGISTEELTDQLREYFNVPEDVGLLITEVAEESPAEEYGLKAGDIIVSIDDRGIDNYYDLVKILGRYDPEDEISVSIIRDRQQKSIKLVLGKQEGRFRYHYGFRPHDFDITLPEIDVDIPEIEIEVPEIDEQEFRELHERIREEMEINKEALKEEMEKLHEQLKDLQFKIKKNSSRVI